jgi:hypothetical protein
MKKRNRYILFLFCLVGMTMTVGIGEAVDAIDLREYQWKNRLLMVFAPSAQDARYQKLAEELESQMHQVIDRDLLVFHVFDIGQSRVNQTGISEPAVKGLQKHFSITSRQFTVVLVGKDGGEKLRRESAVDLDGVFSLIDSMPMRQREIRERE